MPAVTQSTAAQSTVASQPGAVHCLNGLQKVDLANLGDFFRRTHKRALAVARNVLRTEEWAEDAVAIAYRKLVEGKTSQSYFFRTVKQAAIDLARKLKREEELLRPFKELATPKLLGLSECAWGEEGTEQMIIEPPSHRLDDHDPLEILIRQGEERNLRRRIVVARRRVQTQRKFHWIRRTKWARELRIGSKTGAAAVNEMAGSNA